MILANGQLKKEKLGVERLELLDARDRIEEKPSNSSFFLIEEGCVQSFETEREEQGQYGKKDKQ